MSHKTEVLMQIPNIDDLCCVCCRVNPEEMMHPIIKSLVHAQILTCRLLIDTVRCCIASPSVQNVGDLIHVIVSKKFYTSGKLQQHLNQLKIEFTEPESVHPRIYEACLKYTITFKIAPYWNLVGKSFYINGTDFVSQCDVDAIEWNILMKSKNDNAVRLELKPIKFKLFPLTLQYLGLSSSAGENFIKNNNLRQNPISLPSFSTIYVLPKLTKGNIVSVCKTLPERCPFDHYNDLRRHWKNVYSIRLPKNDEDMLFYEVTFPVNPHQRFTYPGVCIFSRKPETRLCTNKNEVASKFLTDLYNKVRSICGTTIKINHLNSKMEVEYSLTFQKTNCNPNDEGDFSQYFRNPDDYIVRPSIETMKQPALSFPGVESMNTGMKNYADQVLTLIGENKKKKTTSKENFCPYVGVDDLSTEFVKFNKPKRSRGNNDFAPNNSTFPTHQKTVVDDTDDILSYYDIPSMHAEYLKYIERRRKAYDSSQQNLSQPHSSEINHSAAVNADVDNEESKQKPVIKSIENVNIDFKNLTSNAHCSDVHKNIGLPSNSFPQDQKVFQNSQLYFDSKIEERDGQLNLEKKSPIALFNKNFAEREEAHSVHNSQINKSFSDNNSILQTLEEIEKSRESDNYFTKRSMELCNQSPERNSFGNNSTPVSPSLLDEMTEYKKIIYGQQKNMTDKKFFYCNRTPFDIFNEKSVKSKNDKEHVTSHKDQKSKQVYTNQDNETNFHSKKLHAFDEINAFNQAKSMNDSNYRFSKPETTLFSEEKSKNILHDENLDKIPSVQKTSEYELENVSRVSQYFNDSFDYDRKNEYSERMMDFHNIVLNKNSNDPLDEMFETQKYCGDFHSILSQSSNESESENHESYKLACKEALTFEN